MKKSLPFRYLILFLLTSLSAREKNRLNIQILVQPQIEADITLPAADSTEMNWGINNAEVKLYSEINEHFGFKLSVDAAEEKILEDAVVWYNPFDFLSLHAGRMKVAFGYDFQKSSEDLMLVSRSKASDFLEDVGCGSRNYGLKVCGKLPLGLGYSAAVYESPNFLKGKGVFSIAELITAQLDWEYFRWLVFNAGYRSEKFLYHTLLEYRANFYDLAINTNWVKDKLHFGAEFFWGDPPLIDYLMEKDTLNFVTLSLRVMSYYDFKIANSTISPVVAFEHIDNGFWTSQVYTGGIRWDIGSSVFLSIDGELLYDNEMLYMRDKKILFQVSYLFTKGIL